MARYYVKSGVKLVCDQGAGKSNLTVTSTLNTKIKGQNWATEADKEFMTNFKSFGACGCNGGSACAAVTIGWSNIAENEKSGGNRYILHDSKLLCSLGGSISIINKESGASDEEDTQKPPSQNDKDKDTDTASTNKNTTNSNASEGGSEEQKTIDSKENEQTSDSDTQTPPKKTPLDDKARAELRAKLTEQYANEHKNSIGEELKTIGGDIWGNLKSGRSFRFFGNYAKGVAVGVKNAVVGTYEGGKALFLYARNRSDLYLDGLSDKERLEQMIANHVQDDQIFKAYDSFVDKIPTNYDEAVLLTTDGIEALAKAKDEVIEKLQTGSDEEIASALGQGVGGLAADVATGGAASKGSKALNKAMKSINFGKNPKAYLTNFFKSKAINSIPGGPQLKALYDRAQQTKNYALEIKNFKNMVKAGFGAVINKKARKKTDEEIKAEEDKMRADYKAEQEKIKAQEKEMYDQYEKEKAAKDADSTNCTVNNKQCTGKDPVNFVTGAMFYQETAFEIPGIIPIQWEYHWFSDSKYKGPLGHGAHHNYDIHLKIKKDSLVLILADGHPAFFPIPSEENEYVYYNRTEKLTLRKIRNDHFEVFDHNTQLTYSLGYKDHNFYHLIKVSNDKNNSIHIEYQNDVISKIIDTVGRIITIESNQQNLIANIRIEHQSKKRELVTYKYNDVGDLTQVIDAKGSVMRMKYKNHLVVSKTGREGQTFYWKYDGFSTGAKCIHTWGDGGILEGFMEYHNGYTTVTDQPHGVTTYYHENNLSTKIVDPLGGEEIREYNEYQELVKIIDEEGHEVVFNYDKYGNLSTVKQPDDATYDYIYDEKGRIQIVTKPEGGTIIRSYKNDVLDSIIEPNGMMTTFEYNEKGLVSKVFDNQDNETHFFYDNDNNLITLKLPDHSISNWEYDEWGQCIKAINPQKHQQIFEYDLMGNATKIQLPDQNTIQLKYDAYGEVIEAIDKDRTVKFQYTPLGNLKTREENGTKVYFQYNNEEELMGIINEHRESYRFNRDAKGNIIREEGFDGLTRKFYRDKAGKVLKVERPDHKYSIYEYDKGGRIARVEHQDGTWATYSYNKDGLLIEAVNPNSHVKFNRDEAGRILSENQDGYTVTSEYGDLGIRTGIKSSLGANINFEHSIMGEVTNMTAKTNENNPWEANYQYNSLGLETERVLPGGIVNSWNYDTSGSPKQHKITAKGREQRSRLYAWDVNSKLQRITNNLTHKATRFNYDAFNSLASAQYEDGSYDYKLPDEVGNLYRTKGKKDREYGKSGKLLRSGATTYNYDEEGNLIQKNTPKGIWKYQWETSGMLQSVIKPDKTNVSFEYDALGRRTAKIVQSNNSFSPSQGEMSARGGQRGSITRFIWDGNVPLHEWKYDLKDKPKTIVDESGKIARDKKEPLENLITWIFDQGTFKPAAKITAEDTYSIITDYLGTPVEMYNSSGEKIWEVEYDIYGKVRKLAKGSLEDCTFRYQGQYEDVETGLYYNRFRYYAPDEGVYISQDPIRLNSGEANFYSYVNDPNSFIDPFGLMPFWKPLKPTGMGHHPIPRTHANSSGMPLLGTKYDSPSWYPNNIDGSDILHRDAHAALKNNGVPFNQKFNGTKEELISKTKTAYEPFNEKGFVKIPKTGEVIAKDVTLSEAVDESVKWNSKNSECPKNK